MKAINNCQNKEAYDSEDEARWDAFRVVFSRGVIVHPYKCNVCEKWHLTKQCNKKGKKK